MNSTINSKHTLLLVDDERLVLATLAQGLSKAGYAVSTAESVDEAEALLASGERPDLVILDVSMPGRSGLELAERLHSFDHIPFLLLTAYSDQAIVEQAAACGALGYLVKPVDTRQLVPAIEAALARAAELRSLRMTGQQLQNALDGEREISIAVGITMVQYRLGRKAAFELLRKTARSQSRRLAELAIDVIKASEALNLGR
ncbi:ANTAR domain-containing response regulator [Methylobacter tundripaludum]|jgi:response regulator NasT|uniref:Response regulator receiver and ANTAR domain protein n=1 Tax=Methylobacter tundripaludum (strain ATCC BAA-1195 / DSM 17260 / SV96) TaxID=697282 RepID=G3IZJ6_METTV|nr:response regulator [Methylobacter tundripaludum]EGW20368.1 response regulator receiver and ANTAR domain protein [Methylobacter tundripaludum SV96]MDD4905315.1 response regulator [Methylobacter tundripaludum]